VQQANRRRPRRSASPAHQPHGLPEEPRRQRRRATSPRTTYRVVRPHGQAEDGQRNAEGGCGQDQWQHPARQVDSDKSRPTLWGQTRRKATQSLPVTSTRTSSTTRRTAAKDATGQAHHDPVPRQRRGSGAQLAARGGEGTAGRSTARRREPRSAVGEHGGQSARVCTLSSSAQRTQTHNYKRDLGKPPRPLRAAARR